MLKCEKCVTQGVEIERLKRRIVQLEKAMAAMAKSADEAFSRIDVLNYDPIVRRGEFTIARRATR